MKKQFLILALSIPIIGLIVHAGIREYRLKSGDEFVLPIEGYDPRDLLKGHYLTYRVPAFPHELCREEKFKEKESCFCLNLEKPEEPMVRSVSNDCSKIACEKNEKLIRGRCTRNFFINFFAAGIERFYIAEEGSKVMDALVREGKASIVVSGDSSGHLQIKDLLINGKSYKNIQLLENQK